MTIRDLMSQGIEKLKSAGIEECDRDAQLLMMYVLDITYTDLFMKYSEPASDEQINKYIDCIEKRSSYYPCQYIIGNQNFMGYEFDVSENVLIPRPETELLVEKALKLVEDKISCKALDMCCGSGCIGISFKLLRKGKHTDDVDVADISDYAIELTSSNNKKLEADCNIIQTDLFDKIDNKYDIILSNPPYIRTSDIEELMADVKNHEPHLALDGGADGLYFYNKIIREARNYLNDNGVIIFEIGYDQAEDLRSIFVDNGYRDIEIIKDYAGLDRIAIAYV